MIKYKYIDNKGDSMSTIPFTLELDIPKNGVYLNQQQIDLLMIVSLNDKNEVRNYIENVCSQFPYMKAEDVIDIENLSLEECKRTLFARYQDTLITYLDNHSMTDVELARIKLERFRVSEEEKEIVLGYVANGNMQDAYQFLEERHGTDFIIKFNRFMKDDFENIKSLSYEQVEELHEHLASDESIDTVIIATGKYDNSMGITANGVMFDPYLTTKGMIYCNMIGKHMRYHALFDYVHLQELVSSGKTPLDHDEVLSQMRTFIHASMDYITKNNVMMDDGSMLINVVEVFNELIEYNKPLNDRENYGMAWEKYFGITLPELMSCFDGIDKPFGVSFMYNETMLEESAIRRAKVEDTLEQIVGLRPGFIDKFGSQMHLEDTHIRTESGKRQLEESFDLLKRIESKGISLECTEFDLHINMGTSQKIFEKKKTGEMTDEYVYRKKKEWISEISSIAGDKGVNFYRITYWSLFDTVDHNLVRTNKKILDENRTLRETGQTERPLLPTMYAGLYGTGKNIKTIRLDSKKTNADQVETNRVLVKKNDPNNNHSSGYANNQILSLLSGFALGILGMGILLWILNLL